ncbi:restriction endonuclease subunit S (plasmid) [Clostridium estertheticum]|uniref:restriction endonuclease subunit S n=1 Tax=Clostridium estertheticum TaxID=238834 RepID=UPI001C7D352C|nr:restriction endonuclease subunit S [Clostridium estertheticum]MBX4262836.1 restriction endonuclease subunit S [Clostridium estertheticum]WLC73130.1 restriction endonuclease subunit S [Clostridium estertheticum]
MGVNGWNVYNLNEVYAFTSGLSKNRKEFGFGYPFVTFKDVFYNFFIPDELTELANTSDKERLNCSVERGDVFLTRTSETLNELGQSSVALKKYPNATFNGFTKRLRPNGRSEIHPEYAGYYFRSPKFRSEITSMSTMTTRASLNNDIMSRLKITLPPLEEQKGLSKILLALDEKIETNNKINKKLEEISQIIFKQWFVDFEFPKVDGDPYKSSAGEMVESELGMIPKEWEVGTIGDYVKVKSGYAFKSSWWKSNGIAVVKIKDINNRTVNTSDCSFVSEKNASNAREFIINGGEILIAMTGATIGKFAIVPKMNHSALVNQRVGKFFLGDKPFDRVSFLYCTLDQSYVHDEIVSRGDGSAQPNISPNGIESIKIIIPHISILDQFNRLMKSNFRKITQNVYENNKLVNLRDTLLLKLMSGEIRVPLDSQGEVS